MKRLTVAGVAAIAALLTLTAAFAATTITVTPSNTQGWSTADSTPGGAVNFVVDNTAPGGVGALQLTTNMTTTAKAQYLHAANTPLAGVNDLSYYTKQNSPSPAVADPAYQLIVFLNGTTGFSTLVFEPYQNPLQGPIIPNAWQQWDVDSGLFWSTRTVVCPNGTVNGTSGGPATYTLAQIKALCPNAAVIGFGVNIGSNNPGYNVETDLFNFNGTIYDFEPFDVATDKDECKDDGWQNATRADGTPFRNQGDCVSYTNTGR
jgi:hypothetical protein